MDFYFKYKFWIIGVACFVLMVGIGGFIYYYNQKSGDLVDTVLAKDNLGTNDNCDEKQESNSSICFVDVKGAVKKPGVYEIDCASKIDDAIKLAGGLKNNAVTSNINLSKMISNEMVIKVSTKNEIKNESNSNSTISECLCPDVDISNCNNSGVIVSSKESGESSNPNDNNNNCQEEQKSDNGSSISENSLVSINTATKEELLTLPGIGESKAVAIIDYRTNNGFFKSIEEIKNVSGIGDALFEKIKDYISI